jgi:hypothetical protein
VPSGQKPAALRAGAKRRRLVAAFVVAAISDALSFGLTFVPPIQWGIDLLTAVLLFVLLGRQWVILPALIIEAVPAVAVFPLWILVVGSIAAWGTIRPARPSDIWRSLREGTPDHTDKRG